jgi:cell division protein ZapA
MGQVAITINGNNYQIACDEGQEERLTRLGAYVDERTAELVKSVGDVGDVRLMVMASLMVTDKLFDAMAETETLRAQAAKAAKEKISEKSDEGLALIVEAVAERIEDIAVNLENA